MCEVIEDYAFPITGAKHCTLVAREGKVRSMEPQTNAKLEMYSGKSFLGYAALMVSRRGKQAI